jgi:predicted transcriptional regulator of viral defense system
MRQSGTEILEIVRELGLLRPRDLTARGIPHTYLYPLERQGYLQRVSRGVYRLSSQEPHEQSALAEACKRLPNAVVCLLSALRFHQIGTQSPYEVWMAIASKARAPRLEYPPLRVVRFSGAALSEGIEEHASPDGPIRVYSVPKTVVDCFRYRNKIGLDVALEALQASLRERRVTVDELWHYARMLRMANVMRPYLEATV